MKLKALDVAAYRIPTDRPESDGTISWDSTTVVVVEAVTDSGERGLGFGYASPAAATVAREVLEPVAVGALSGPGVDAVGSAWEAMVAAVRNAGRPGVCAQAVSAVDVSLWDLKARLAGKPLFRLLGAYRESVPIYGSGGFTSYTDQELADQLGGWVAEGIPRVKMKIGTDRGRCSEVDVHRVEVARKAIGDAAELFVDANGAYTVKQALAQASRFADEGVSYFEEPVSSDQLAELRFVREHAPMQIAAGEYGYDPWYFHDMLAAKAVDVVQADVTRCLGVTGWLQAAALAYAFAVPFSAHTSHSIHAQVGCAAPQLSHVEYFHDHVRIESMLFDGAPRPVGGNLPPDPDRPGLGLELKRKEAEAYRIG